MNKTKRKVLSLFIGILLTILFFCLMVGIVWLHEVFGDIVIGTIIFLIISSALAWMVYELNLF